MTTILTIGCAALAVLTGAVAGLFGGLAALIFVLLSVFLLLVVRDYRVGVIIIIIAVPFLSAFEQGPNVFVLLLSLTIPSLAIRKLVSHQSVVSLPPVVWIGLVTPVIIGAVIGYTHIHEAQFNLRNTPIADSYGVKGYIRLSLLFPLGMIAVAWLIANAARDSRRPLLFLVPVAITATLMIAQIVGLIIGSGLDLARIQSQREFFSELGHHANEFGPLFAVASGPFLFLIADSRGRNRVFSAIVLSLLLVGITLVFSRGGYVAFLVVLVTFLVMRAHTRIILGALAIGVIAILAVPDAVLERATTGMDSRSIALAESRSESDELTAGRFALYSMFAPEVLENPVFGGGTGSTAWSAAVKNGWTSMLHPHNMYLRALMDAGAVGFALWGFFWFRMIGAMKTLSASPQLPQSMRSVFAGTFAGSLAMLASGLTGGDWLPSISHPFLWYSVGLAIAFWRPPAIHASTDDVMHSGRTTIDRASVESRGPGVAR